MNGHQSNIELPSAGAGRLGGAELSGVCQKLLDAESRSGLVQGRDFVINLQARYINCSLNNGKSDLVVSR